MSRATKVTKKALLLVRFLLRRNTLTPAMLRGPAPNGHPCPCGALAASLPLGPLRIAGVRPAPKSRFVVSGLACKKIKSQSALLLSQSGLPAAAILRTPPSASRAATRDRGRIENRRSLLIFMRDRSDDTNRDLGAGRTQVALRGPSGMDAARAAPRHGWRMAAGPRSVAGAEGTRRSRAQPGARTLGYLVSFQVTRRRRNTSAVGQSPL